MQIAILRKDNESAVSYYRTTPMLEMCRAQNWHCEQIHPKAFSFDTAHRFDILFCHRPGSDGEINALANAKIAGCKVWLDIDDLLWKIPISNDAAQMYNPRVHGYMLQAMENADVISCSTQELKNEIYLEFGKEAVVINNAWNNRPGSDHIESPKNRIVKKALYRGSNTHAGDVYLHREAFRPCANIEWQFFGLMPWMLLKQYGGHLENVIINTWTSSVRNYFETLYAIGPDVLVFPLENNAFNRCKSNIAWIEATQSGAVCIAPSYMPEFADVPCLHYKDTADLIRILQLVSDGKSPLNSLHSESVDVMKSRFALSEINRIRVSIASTL
jgi:hypothetical protein